MVIRDDKGNIYSIPEQELTKYVVVKAGKSRPKTLCLEPTFDAVRGPHDGWAYAQSDVRPAKKAATKAASAPAKSVPGKARK